MKSPAFKNDVGVEIQSGDIKLVSRWAFDLILERTSEDTPISGYSNDQYGSWNSLARFRPPGELLELESPRARGIKSTYGYQVFAWGVADKANPTDNLKPPRLYFRACSIPKRSRSSPRTSLGILPIRFPWRRFSFPSSNPTSGPATTPNR